MAKNVVIIGGGIIGLCTAYYLQEEGHRVTLIDQSEINSGASFVNAGYITPSHIIPLSSPGIITKGIKWMFNPESPFYVKPRLNRNFLLWALNFKKSATTAKVEKAIPVIKEINLESRKLFEDLKQNQELDFHYIHKGLLMVYKTEKAGESEWNVGQKAIKHGLNAQNLNKSEVQKLGGNVKMDILGGVYYDCDAHSTPGGFMKSMKSYLQQKGVEFRLNEPVIDIELKGDRIQQILTGQGKYVADEYVLAAGAWSPILAKKIGLGIQVEAGKGYRINVNKKTGIETPTILLEAKVAVTPMQGFTRFAGTMELGGINHQINPVRVNAIAKAAQSYYPEIVISEEEKKDASFGLRPCTPDGLPFIGKSKVCKNLVVATGHAMMGWSLGPITGKLVSEIISERKPGLDLDPFHPDRKF